MEPSGRETTRSLEELEAEIGELAANLDAATCRLLLAIAEYDAREGWARGGFRSCAHWLGWRIGLDSGAARERVRVGRALARLPQIRAAFAAGEVSYSKVRAMTRVATPRTEEELLAVARHGTAWHLEKLVRLFRQVTSAEERQLAIRQHAERYLETWTDSEGMLVIRGRLPPEAGAMVQAALEAAMASLRAEAPSPAAPPASPSSRAATLPGDVSAETPLRPDGQSLASSAHVSAETHRPVPPASSGPADVSAETPARPIHSLPVAPLRQVDPMELARLAADALGRVAEWSLRAASGEGPIDAREREAGGPGLGREGRFEAVLHLDAEVLSQDADVGRCELEGGPRISAETARRLCCSSPVVTLVHGQSGEPLGPGRRTRRISAPLWRALRDRDPVCAFPGCTCRRGLVVHHVEHWAHGGATKLDNLIPVCRSHHFALHEGGFRVEGRAPDELRFFTPSGAPIPRCPPPSRAPADPALALAAAHRDLGLTIGPETGLTRWWGERMDYDWAVSSLLAHETKTDRPG